MVNDQIGRLSFTQDIAAGIRHLLESGAEYGTYNLTNDGEPQSWADVAADVYELSGKSRDAVVGVSTENTSKVRLLHHGRSTACWPWIRSRQPGSSRGT